MQEYSVDGQLLRAIKSFYCRLEVCVRVNGKQSKPFHVGVGLRQGCVLSPLLFIVYMNWIDKCSQADECATIGNCKISRLLFADDLVLLSSTESGLQRALNSFADACNTAGMKISTAKTEVLHLSRNPDQCVLQANGATLKQVEKFKYLGVAFTSDGRQDEELDTRIGKASAVMRALQARVVIFNRFACFWPKGYQLGSLGKSHQNGDYLKQAMRKFALPQESNLQPLHYRSTALPLELEKTPPRMLNFGYLNPATCLYDFNNKSIKMLFDVCRPEL